MDGSSEFRWETTYNDNREVASRTDPLGNVVATSQYGAYHLPKQIAWSGANVSGSSPASLSAGYDELGNPATKTLTRADGTVETETYTHDAQGRRRGYSLNADGISAGLAYTYYADGMRKSVTLPSGVVTEYEYDAAVRMRKATSAVGEATYVTEQTWTPEGLPLGTSFADGSKACRVYDSADRLEYLAHSLETAADCSVVTGPESFTAPLRDFRYQYDGFGNRKQTDERGNFLLQSFAEQQTYAFDVRDQLVVAAFSEHTDVYGYDWKGNRTSEVKYPQVPTWQAENFLAPPAGVSSQVSKRYEYNGRDQLVRVRDALDGEAIVTEYQFDAAGHTTSKTVAGTGTTTYNWNADDTLRRATSPAGDDLAGFQYDSGSLRRRKTSSAAGEGDRVYVYDGSSLVAELDAATGSPKLEYVYGTELWGVIDYSSSQSNPTVQWMHRDGMRSVVERTASIAGVATRVAGPFRYDAFGGYRTTPEAVQPGADGQSKIGYTGHVFDVETGLVYAKARYYQPELGRWLSQDALEGQMDQAPSLNRYSYALENPYRYWDPTGYAPLGAGTEMAVRRNMTAAEREAYNKSEKEMAPTMLLVGVVVAVLGPLAPALIEAVPGLVAAAGGGAVVGEGAVDATGVVLGAAGCVQGDQRSCLEMSASALDLAWVQV